VTRLPAVVTLAVLLVCLAVACWLAVPWSPLPGASLVPDAARDFTAAERAREAAFHAAVRPPAYASLVVGLLVAVVVGLTPLGARLVAALPGWWWSQVLLATLAVAVLGRLLTLPFGLRAEAVRREYGLSTQTWATWSADVAKGLVVDAVLTGALLLLVVGLARAAPQLWWAWAAGLTAALVIVVSFAYPLVVEPVFNRFTPLPAGELREDLLALAERDGVPVEQVLVADASRRTTALNAYVSGFGGTRRIVLYDTLLASASPAEVELVVAHELAHARNRDVLTGTLLGALGGAAAVVGLYLLLSATPLLRWAGALSVGDPRVVPLLLALAAVGALLAGPLANVVSRRLETRADVSALDLTRDPATFAAAQQRLARTNLSDLDPHPLAYWLFATHPSTTERLALAREWQRLRAS
jgi:STE24 endopeptidase